MTDKALLHRLVVPPYEDTYQNYPFARCYCN